MKAISKFKGLLSKDSASTPSDRSREAAPRGRSLDTEKKQAERTNREHAAAVLRERERLLETRSKQGSWQSLPGEKGHAHDPTDVEPLFLGIGTGSMDEFSSPKTETPSVTDIVSDSPTAVDFNVYDRAFEAEIERIKRSTSRRKATGPLYHTRHLEEKRKYRTDDGVTVCLALSPSPSLSPFKSRAVVPGSIVRHRLTDSLVDGFVAESNACPDASCSNTTAHSKPTGCCHEANGRPQKAGRDIGLVRLGNNT